ncbi:Fic family protein [Streptomyces sp. NPDC051578]|uniref:Fic family protein n=1 Tax=Streptomyces sp. NPDC051578 TaxID=3365662 RepID=UPI0037AB3FF8
MRYGPRRPAARRDDLVPCRGLKGRTARPGPSHRLATTGPRGERGATAPERRLRQGRPGAIRAHPRTWQDFAACLGQSADPSVPLPARAARAYLDIAFFHPYPDGNARLALLVLAHVLEREGVRLDEVGRCRPPATRTTPTAPWTWRFWSPY